MASDEVVENIKNMIRSGELKPGQRFPAERNLALRFGVSRNTVREALHYFEVIGLASTRRGHLRCRVDEKETQLWK